jgi:hypothetical protein
LLSSLTCTYIRTNVLYLLRLKLTHNLFFVWKSHFMHHLPRILYEYTINCLCLKLPRNLLMYAQWHRAPLATYRCIPVKHSKSNIYAPHLPRKKKTKNI